MMASYEVGPLAPRGGFSSPPGREAGSDSASKWTCCASKKIKGVASDTATYGFDATPSARVPLGNVHQTLAHIDTSIFHISHRIRPTSVFIA